MTADRPPGEPALRVIRGDATPEEIAALVAILMSRRTAGFDLAGVDRAAVDGPRPRPSTWSDPSRLLRRPPQPGPGAWRRSALPG
jgi:Acyl-CoA carboxylase epsilon subunit